MKGPLDRAAHYLVHQKLASGGMGEVYLGTMASPAGRRPVAVKRVAAGHLQQQEAVQRLIAEAKLGFQLRHANVCQVLDLVLADETVYLILEFVDGMDLRSLVKASALRLDVSVALHIARETARALDYAHRARSGDGAPLHLIHGDVTPQNILLSVEGEVKLADFGIARALGAASPGSDVVGGTLGFMAPEVVTGHTDHRSDIYSLGATLHYTLVGRPPLAPGVSALAERDDVSPSLRDLVSRCLAIQPRARFSSASELETQLAFEMARKFPEFTPSIVSARVRAARGVARLLDASQTATLFTIGTGTATLVDEDVKIDSGKVLALREDVVGSEPERATMTLEGIAAPESHTVQSHRRWPIAAFALVLCAAALIFVLRGNSAPDAGTAPEAKATQIGTDAGPMSDAARVVRTSESQDAAIARPTVVKGKTATPNSARHPSRSKRKNVVAIETAPGFLSVNSVPWGAVHVDGRIVAKETPALRIPLPPGNHQVSVVFGDGSRSKTRAVRLKPGQNKSLGFKQ